MLLHKALGVPIIPVYLSEEVGESNGSILYEEFDTSSIAMLPDIEHHRDSAHILIEEYPNIRYEK